MKLYGWDDGAHSFLRQGKEKVSAETALSFLAYPLRRAINPLGADALIASFNKRSRKPEKCNLFSHLDANLCLHLILFLLAFFGFSMRRQSCRTLVLTTMPSRSISSF